MGALNTFFNGQTARNTAATARATGQMVAAGRRWELQQRGWITPGSTPDEVAAVEAILAAQMRARIEMQNGRAWPFQTVAVAGGFAIGFVLICTLATAGSPQAAWSAPLVFILLSLVVATVVGLGVRAVRRREDRRSKALARAVVRDGVCQWCRQPAPHILEGEQTAPRVYHAIDIERAIDPGSR